MTEHTRKGTIDPLEAKIALEMNLQLLKKNLEIQLEELMGDPLGYPEVSVLGGAAFLGTVLSSYGIYQQARNHLEQLKEEETQ